MDPHERENLQLLINSMGDVLRVGFAPSIDPLALVKAWSIDVEMLLIRAERAQRFREKIRS